MCALHAIRIHSILIYLYMWCRLSEYIVIFIAYPCACIGLQSDFKTCIRFRVGENFLAVCVTRIWITKLMYVNLSWHVSLYGQGRPVHLIAFCHGLWAGWYSGASNEYSEPGTSYQLFSSFTHWPWVTWHSFKGVAVLKDLLELLSK